MPLSHRQLDAFRRVMETGSVTHAAERIHMSQPAVSKLLAALERELGLTLFRRVRKRLVPTDDAHQMYEEVLRQFATLGNLQSFAEALKHADAGELHIASAASIGHTLVADALAETARRHPHTRLSLHVATNVAQTVLGRKVDLGFSVLPQAHPAIHTVPLLHARAVCILPAGHAMAARARIVPEDLRDQPFISFASDARMRHIVDAVFEQRRVSRRTQYEVFSSQEASALVARGMGVSIVEPLSSYYATPPGVVVKAFEPAIDFTFHLLQPRFKERTRLAQEFVDLLKAGIGAKAQAGADAPFALQIRLEDADAGSPG